MIILFAIRAHPTRFKYYFFSPILWSLWGGTSISTELFPQFLNWWIINVSAHGHNPELRLQKGISMNIPQCIVLESPDTLSQWLHIRFWLSVSGNSSEKHALWECCKHALLNRSKIKYLSSFTSDWHSSSGTQPQGSDIGLICLFGTFFGTRQYPKVQKVTKQPFPYNPDIHSHRWYCWSMSWLGNDFK